MEVLAVSAPAIGDESLQVHLMTINNHAVYPTKLGRLSSAPTTRCFTPGRSASCGAFWESRRFARLTVPTNDVESELRFHRIADFSDGQLHRRLAESGHHLIWCKRAQVAALCTAGAV